eukprot:g5643.t1
MDCSQLEGEIAEIRDEIDSVLFPQVQQQGKSLEAAMGRNHELLEQLKQATAQKEKYLLSIERTRAALRRRWTVSASRGASTWNARLHELLARVLLGVRSESASSGPGNSDTLATTATETDAEDRNLLWDVLNREEGLEFGKCVGQLVGAVEQGAILKQRTEMMPAGGGAAAPSGAGASPYFDLAADQRSFEPTLSSLLCSDPVVKQLAQSIAKSPKCSPAATTTSKAANLDKVQVQLLKQVRGALSGPGAGIKPPVDTEKGTKPSSKSAPLDEKWAQFVSFFLRSLRASPLARDWADKQVSNLLPTLIGSVLEVLADTGRNGQLYSGGTAEVAKKIGISAEVRDLAIQYARDTSSLAGVAKAEKLFAQMQTKVAAANKSSAGAGSSSCAVPAAASTSASTAPPLPPTLLQEGPPKPRALLYRKSVVVGVESEEKTTFDFEAHLQQYDLNKQLNHAQMTLLNHFLRREDADLNAVAQAAVRNISSADSGKTPHQVPSAALKTKIDSAIRDTLVAQSVFRTQNWALAVAVGDPKKPANVADPVSQPPEEFYARTARAMLDIRKRIPQVRAQLAGEHGGAGGKGGGENNGGKHDAPVHQAVNQAAKGYAVFHGFNENNSGSGGSEYAYTAAERAALDSVIEGKASVDPKTGFPPGLEHDFSVHAQVGSRDKEEAVLQLSDDESDGILFAFDCADGARNDGTNKTKGSSAPRTPPALPPPLPALPLLPPTLPPAGFGLPPTLPPANLGGGPGKGGSASAALGAGAGGEKGSTAKNTMLATSGAGGAASTAAPVKEPIERATFFIRAPLLTVSAGKP